MKIKAKVKDKNVLAMLRRAGIRVKDLKPVLLGIASDLEDDAEESFEKQMDLTTGERWARLSKTRLRQRVKSGVLGKKLEVTGDLARSVNSRASRSTIKLGTNSDYAPTHQFGAKKGQYGEMKRGGPIPWGDVPARPFLHITNKRIEQAKEDLIIHLTKI